MAQVTIQDLLLAGCHFGHITRRWNPKMKRFIFMERNGIHIIDLNKTLLALNTALEQLTAVAKGGGQILFVGTKRQAKDLVRLEAEHCNMPYVTERWLGGTLTNFITIKKSIKRLKNLEKKSTDGTYDKLNKKEILMIERDKEKLDKVLGGIVDMNHLPAAIFMVDSKKETIAIHEARRLGIPIFAMLDTNSDPEMVEYPIPSNDDAFKSISLITHAVAEAIKEGQASRSDFETAVMEGGSPEQAKDADISLDKSE